MKLKIVSDDVKEAINTLRWEKRRNYFVARTTRKLSKPHEKELDNIIKSFGGVDGVLHEYTLLYDAERDLNFASEFGYYYGVKDNVSYLPPAITAAMCDLVVKNKSQILVPFAGYGNTVRYFSDKNPDSFIYSCNNEHFKNAIKLNTLGCNKYSEYFNDTDILETNIQVGSIILRGQLNNFKFIQKCVDKLEPGGMLITLVYSDMIYSVKKSNLNLQNSHLYGINILTMAGNTIDLNGNKEISIVTVERI